MAVVILIQSSKILSYIIKYMVKYYSKNLIIVIFDPMLQIYIFKEQYVINIKKLSLQKIPFNMGRTLKIIIKRTQKM